MNWHVNSLVLKGLREIGEFNVMGLVVIAFVLGTLLVLVLDVIRPGKRKNGEAA